MSALLPATASVECVRLDRFGYDRRGRYYGAGDRLYRLTDTGDDDATGLDFLVRAKSRKEAARILLATITVVRLRLPHYMARAERGPDQSLLDFESMCLAWAQRDAVNAIAEHG